MTGDNGGPAFGGAFGFDTALNELAEAVSKKPEQAMAAWTRFATDCLQAGVAAMTVGESGPSARAPVEPERGDRRFRDPAWREQPVYFGLMQGYLLWSRLLRDLVDVADLDPSKGRKARFAVDAMIDALAPTNTLMGNPAALRKAYETGGESISRGARQFLEDLASNGGRPRQVDRTKFVVGRDLAASPGKVVFRNA